MDTPLEKILRITGMLKTVEAQITGLEKMGLQLVNTDNIVYFNFALEDLNQQVPDQSLEKLLYGDQGPEMGMPTMFAMPGFMLAGNPQYAQFQPTPRVLPHQVNIHRFRLDTEITLLTIGLIVGCLKQKKRDSY